ncbi:uncharacterized protein RHO17_021640 [Thomomys bottae]
MGAGGAGNCGDPEVGQSRGVTGSKAQATGQRVGVRAEPRPGRSGAPGASRLGRGGRRPLTGSGASFRRRRLGWAALGSGRRPTPRPGRALSVSLPRRPGRGGARRPAGGPEEEEEAAGGGGGAGRGRSEGRDSPARVPALGAGGRAASLQLPAAAAAEGSGGRGQGVETAEGGRTAPQALASLRRTRRCHRGRGRKGRAWAPMRRRTSRSVLYKGGPGAPSSFRFSGVLALRGSSAGCLRLSGADSCVGLADDNLTR